MGMDMSEEKLTLVVRLALAYFMPNLIINSFVNCNL